MGTKDLIKCAVKKRQMVWGGMRQAGIMLAAGIVSLERMIDRLRKDQQNALTLAEGLIELGFQIDMETVQSNMVFLNVPTSFCNLYTLVRKLKGKSIRIGLPRGNRIRVVLHTDILKRIC